MIVKNTLLHGILSGGTHISHLIDGRSLDLNHRQQCEVSLSFPFLLFKESFLLDRFLDLEILQ